VIIGSSAPSEHALSTSGNTLPMKHASLGNAMVQDTFFLIDKCKELIL
jgi:hypothetical protein